MAVSFGVVQAEIEQKITNLRIHFARAFKSSRKSRSSNDNVHNQK